MRGTFAKLTSRPAKTARRTAKRAILFAMLASIASPALDSAAVAQMPQGRAIHSRYVNQQSQPKILHRAPVKVIAGASSVVRKNPFFVETAPKPTLNPAIQLASGHAPAMRLNPGGTTIGFAPIGGDVAPIETKVQTTQPSTPARSAPKSAQHAPKTARAGIAPQGLPAQAMPSSQTISEAAGVMKRNAFDSAPPQAAVPHQSTAPQAPKQYGSARIISPPAVVGVPMGQTMPSGLNQTKVDSARPLDASDVMMDSRPLIHSSASQILGPSTGVALDRFAPPSQSPSPVSVAEGVAGSPNAFERHRQTVQTPSQEPVADSNEPTGLNAIHQAAPLATLEQIPKTIAHSSEAGVESPVVDEASRVVPVTDARDDQRAIQETQPIYFSMSDSSDVIDEDAAAASQADQSDVTEVETKEDQQAGGPVHMETPVLPHSEPATMSLSDMTNGSEESGMLSEIETPVHLSPVVTLAERIPSPVAGEASPVRNNPNVDDDRIIVGSPMIRALTQAPSVNRQPIAVTTPPIKITRSEFNESSLSPAVDGIAFDPTTKQTQSVPSVERVAVPENRVAESLPLEEDVVEEDTFDGGALETAMVKSFQDSTIHVATDAPRLNVKEAELPPPVTESQAPVLPKPEQWVESNVEPTVEEPKALQLPRVPAQLASSQPGTFGELPEARGLAPMPESPSTHAAAPEKKTKKSATLNLSRAQVRSMTIGGRLRRVSIANKDVCQAFASGANQLKLIGTGIGKTKLTIWADIAPGEPTRVQSFDIEVSNDVDAIGDKVSAHTALLNDSIDKAFPRASVVVSRDSGKLFVTGHCDDEDTAKQIVRMVRKSCLVPVQDDLKVR